MLFFTRILRLKQEKIAQREQRQSERYAVGAGFPLSVTLVGESGEVLGQAADLSVTGVRVVATREFPGAAGAKCSCRLEIEQHRLEVPAQIVHVHAADGKTAFGVALQFSEFAAKMAFMQLLEAVASGATLARTATDQAVADASWLREEQYRGDGKTQLTVWRETESRAIDSFEFQLDDYFVRGHAKSPQPEIFTQETVKDLHKAGYSDPALKQYEGEGEEIRRLFRWVVSNLSQGVPDDVCAFLGKHVTAFEPARSPAPATGS